MNLLKELKAKYNLTIIFITHDLGVVANIAERVAVMYAGDIVELGLVNEIFYDPIIRIPGRCCPPCPSWDTVARSCTPSKARRPTCSRKSTGCLCSPQSPGAAN